MRASAHVDQAGTTRQLVEQRLAQNAAGAVGQGQQADQDVGAFQERLQAIGAGMAFNTIDGLRRPAPARAGKAEAAQALQHGAPQHTQAQHADAPRRGRIHAMGLPAPFLLLLPVGVPVAVQGQHGQGHVLDHAVDDAGLDHAHHRQRLGNDREVELVDTGAGGKQHFQIREPGGQVRGRFPGGEVTHVSRVAGVGPNAKRQLRHVLCKPLGPHRTADGVGLVEKSHV
ncbi:hypothetical protein FQZ97_815900 [compost metagenome]